MNLPPTTGVITRTWALPSQLDLQRVSLRLLIVLPTHVDDTICGGSGPLFSKAVKLRHRFAFRKWQVGEVMFGRSKYVQNTDNKEIMITQTEFAVKCETILLKAEIHAFLGVSGSISWLAGQTRPDVSCQASQLQQTLPQPTVTQVCCSNVVVRRVHQHADWVS